MSGPFPSLYEAQHNASVSNDSAIFVLSYANLSVKVSVSGFNKTIRKGFIASWSFHALECRILCAFRGSTSPHDTSNILEALDQLASSNSGICI